MILNTKNKDGSGSKEYIEVDEGIRTSDEIISSLLWFGENEERIKDIDVCENGQVFLGLTEILPAK